MAAPRYASIVFFQEELPQRAAHTSRMSTIDERGKQIITELDLRSAAAGDTLRIDEDSMLTPLAQDIARERSIQIERVRRLF